jgi:hypothetical protein
MEVIDVVPAQRKLKIEAIGGCGAETKTQR